MKIVIKRGETVPFEELPNNSLALDGYVQGPAIDVAAQRYSFDHHAGCLRLVTKATCAQVLDALILGLDPRQMTVYLNDIDADTVLAVWLLRHPTAVTHPRVRNLVEDVGNVDAHGPSYFPFVRDSDLCQRFFKGAMEPEARVRREGAYATVDLYNLLSDCLRRTDKLIFRNKRFPICKDRKLPHYEITHRGSGWVMSRSSERVFGALYRDGYSRVVSYHELSVEQANGEIEKSWAYTIAKQSDLVTGFEIPAILARLNDIEAGWGGGSSIGGAPRRSTGSRSFLDPDRVFALIEAAVTGHDAGPECLSPEQAPAATGPG
ncbi:MAG TPA: hypothetical protein V6D23_06210 [Candidatus Obscuribacterales bacterium]